MLVGPSGVQLQGHALDRLVEILVALEHDAAARVDGDQKAAIHL